MFLFRFTAVDPQHTYRHLQYEGPTLENGLDVLSGFVSDGWVVEDVHYLDINSASSEWTALDAEVFDGQLMSEPLKDLEQQWQVLLAGTDSLSAGHYPVFVDTIERRLEGYGYLIEHFIQASNRMEQSLQQVWAANLNEPYRSRLLRHIEQTHQRFAEQVAKYERIQSQLAALLAAIKIRQRLRP